MIINKKSNEKLDDLLANDLTLVDVYAVWCGPCRMLSPIVEELSKKIDVIKVNADENIDVAEKYQIYSIPTLLLFKEKKLVANSVGYKELEELNSWITSYM